RLKIATEKVAVVLRLMVLFLSAGLMSMMSWLMSSTASYVTAWVPLVTGGSKFWLTPSAKSVEARMLSWRICQSLEPSRNSQPVDPVVGEQGGDGGQPPLALVMLLMSRTTFTSVETAFLFQLTGPPGATFTLRFVVFAGTPPGGPKVIVTAEVWLRPR